MGGWRRCGSRAGGGGSTVDSFVKNMSGHFKLEITLGKFTRDNERKESDNTG